MQNTNMITVADFLPKYPYINSSSDTFIAYHNESFEQAIYKKKEFYENRLERLEKKPSQPGALMKHQQNVAKYMSIVTPYDGLLLFHAMGSGKGCSVVGIGEELKATSNNNSGKIKGMIFLARGPNILNNIAKELVYVCTDGRYIPEGIDKLKPEMRMAKLKRSLSPFYNFYTIDKFLKYIKTMSDSQIKDRFSNYAFCIDEVHNLRTKDSVNKTTPMAKDYYQIHKFLHMIQNKKVILLSGTPMADLPSEIADIMNLILPMDKQMPTGSDFDNEFLIQNPINPLIYKVNPETRDDLVEYFKGRVSYLKSIQASVNVDYMGDNIGLLQYLNVYVDEMDPESIQNQSYLAAYKKDTQKLSMKSSFPEIKDLDSMSMPVQSIQDSMTGVQSGKEDGMGTGLFHNSQQASIAVFPNGTYGSVGFKQYIKETKSSGLLHDKGVQNTEFTLNKSPVDEKGNKIPSLMQFLTTKDPKYKLSDQENKLNQLSKISVKFANIIDMLIKRNNGDEPKGSSFVYCNWVTGSGCILFAKILELFGFKKANGGEKTKGLRYALLTSAVATDNQISNLIETFNQPENVYGEIINVVIGSKIISEGVSFKNVQNVHILSPHWNYTVTEQALSRALRAFSHTELEKQLHKKITVSVYLHTTIAAITNSDNTVEYDINQSIDINMYEKSEHKDISIKRIEYIMKQAAFDCALNYTRNYRGQQNKDGSRECDYGDCNYKCEGIEGPRDLTNLDLSTYRLYYQKDRIKNLIRIILLLFRTEFIISFDQLKQRHADGFSEYEILSAMNQILNSNTPIYNKYGFLSYIASFSNFYFLVDSLGTTNMSTLSYYYTKYPPIHSSTTFNDIVSSQTSINYPKMISKMCKLSFGTQSQRF